MTPFTVSELQRLMGPQTPPCISLFMPTHRDFQAAKQDRIRFKNLLGEAERLLAVDHSSREVAALLGDMNGFATEEYWRDQLDGLAVFRSPDLLLSYRLPMELSERVVVADSFHIRPVVRFLQSNQLYYVLALSQNEATLYHGTRDSLDVVGVRDMPGKLTDAVGEEVRRGFLNAHPSAAGGASTYHGHGGPDEDKKHELTTFFRAIDEAIWSLLRDSHAPLILAGVGYYHPLYRAVSRYQHLADDGVEGNVERLSLHELHGKVWPVAGEILKGREDQGLEEYHRVHGRGLSSEDLDEVARATVQGRVRRLMVARGGHVWGVFDSATGEVTRREAQADSHDDDVVDDVAQAVLARGGEVLVLEPDRMPGGSPVAAVLRW